MKYLKCIRFLIVGVLLFQFNFQATGQNETVIDSLKNALKLADTDLEKSDINNRLAWQYTNIDLEKAVSYGQSGIEWAKKAENDIKLGYAHYITGFCNVELYHYSVAIEHLQKALEIQIDLEDYEMIERCFYKMAVCHFELGEHNQALELLLKAVDVCKSNGYNRQLISNYIEIATVFNELGSYDKAIEYEELALKLSEELDLQHDVNICHNNMGSIYLQIEKYEEALFHYGMALKGWHEAGQTDYEAVTYLNIGLVNSLKNDHEKALSYYHKAISMADSSNKIFEVRSNRLMAVSLMETGEFNDAIKHLQHARRVAKETESIVSEHQAYESLAEVYKRKGMLDSAYHYFSEFSRLRDTILRRDAWDKSIQMEAAYSVKEKKQELALKNKEVELLNKEKQLVVFRRNMTIVISILAVLFLIVVYSRQRVRHKKDKQLHAAQIEIEQLRSENLERDLMYKNKQLISYALQLEQKRDMISEIKEKVNGIDVEINNELVNDKMNHLNNYIDIIMNTEEDWEEFKMHYEQVHIDFFKSLKETFPELSNKELRLCALLNLNLATKEIANILRLSPKSIEIARYRLRKKLGINKGENLIDFIINHSSLVSSSN